MRFPPTRPTGSPARPAFTLVELLVVIGIIALLISILLPALNAARRQAVMVKCASNLRQCGAALQLYAATYRGYGVPIRLGGGQPTKYEVSQNKGLNEPYDLYGFSFGDNSGSKDKYGNPTSDQNAAWWFNFLAKFISQQRGGAADSTPQAQTDVRNSPFWCPSWQAVPSSDPGGFQPFYTGYSMNYMVTMTPSYPSYNQEPDGSKIVPPSEWFNILWHNKEVDPRGGRWYQLGQIKMPAQRCFLADSTYIMLVCWQYPTPIAPAGKWVEPPPQSALPSANSLSPYSTTAWHGQNAFDCYRHGVYPSLTSQGYFSQKGGKVSYNILFFDGHVANSNDRADAYRSVRMRYPG